MSSSEPATAHFTSKQLADFLEQLEREAGEDAARMRSEVFAPSTRAAQRALPRALSPNERPNHWVEPATSLAHVPLTSVGVPRWRARALCEGEGAPRRERDDVSHARLLHVATQDEDDECTGLSRRARARHVVWFVACALILIAAGTLAWTLRASPTHVPNVEAPHARSKPASEHPGEAERPITKAVEPGPAVEHLRAAALPTNTRERRSPARAAPRAVATKRDAVDRLFAGRTHAALETYQAWLSTIVDDARPADIVRVVQLLERQLEACANLMGAPCDL